MISRTPGPIVNESIPLSDWSTIQNMSPGMKLCELTLFDEIDDVVPLPYFGLSP